ncbi:ABC transporter substrate-binding protein [Bordetella sp. 2513F-2]
MKLLSLTIFAAALAAAVPGAQAQDADTILLGFTTAKSGPTVTFTRRNEIAVNLAVADINAAGGVNGKKLAVKLFDTAGKPDQAAAAVRHFANDTNALAIVGPYTSSEARVAFPVGERAKIVQMAIGSAAPGLAKPYKYAFRNTSDEGYLFTRLMTVLKEKGVPYQNAALAYATDDVGGRTMGEKTFPQIFKEFGVTPSQSISFPTAVFDLSTQVAQLKQNPPDVIGLGAFPEPTVVLLKELARQGLKSRIIGGTQSADWNLIQRAGADAEGSLVSTTYNPADERPHSKAFSDAFVAQAKAAGETGDLRPNMYDAAAYTIVRLYAEAMTRGKVTGDPAKVAAERDIIRQQLLTITDFETVEGHHNGFTDGDALKTAYTLEVKNGAWHMLGSKGPNDLK